MRKVARKPSGDPVQEKLRQHKDVWNKEVSQFIENVKQVKKTMNGFPSKAFPQKSKITEPIPIDAPGMLNELATTFQDIAQKGSGIAEEQLDYSKTRRKSQPKRLAPAGQPAPIPAPTSEPKLDLTQQLTAANAEYELIKIASDFEEKYLFEKEASNPITRFFTRLFNPGIGWGKAADIRRARVSMLKYAASAYKGLNKYQVLIVGSKNKIADAKRRLDQIHNDWENVAKAYVIFKQSHSASAPDKGGTIESQIKDEDLKEEKKLQEIPKDETQLENQLGNPDEDSPENKINKNVLVTPPKPNTNVVLQPNVKRMVGDLIQSRPFLNGFSSDEMMEFESAVERMMTTQKIEPDFTQLYGAAVSSINRDLGTSGISFSQIARQLIRMEAQEKAKAQKELDKAEKEKAKEVAKNLPAAVPANLLPDEKASVPSSQIEKVAQDFIKKWVGKNLLKLSPFDTTVSNRLACFELAGKIRLELDQVMDLIEEGLDTEKLDPAIRDVNSKMLQLRGLTRTLHMGLPPEKRKMPH